MKVIIAKDHAEASRLGADIIENIVRAKPDCTLGLATGSTPIGTYKQLVEWYEKGDIDFSETKTVNLDEYCGLTAENVNSYHYFMKDNLFSHINIDMENTHVPDGSADDIEKECTRCDKLIDSLGGQDLQLLGLGHNGHIGFNEPSDSFPTGTHKVKLTENTIEANSRLFDNIDEVPRYAITMGVRNILTARHILLVVSGADKADALRKTLYGPVTPQVPASILQLHPHVTVVADEAALPEEK